MKKLSQKELLEEGIWDRLKPSLTKVGMAAKGAWTIGKYATEKLAPELYNPISNMVAGVKDLNQKVIKATTPETKFITDKLANQGFDVISLSKLRMAQGDEKQLYRVQVKLGQNYIRSGDPNPDKLLLVDTDGQIVRDLSVKNAVTGGKNSRKAKRPKPQNSTPNPP